MARNGKGPFRADHVGSLPRPERLLEARQQRKAGELSAEALRKLEDECIAQVAKLQQDIGFHGITDGEFRREVWHLDFLTQFDNVEVGEGRFYVGMDDNDEAGTGFRPQCMVTKGKLRRSHGIQTEDFKYLKSVVSETPKVCVPSPTLMHFRGGRDAVDRTAYPDMDGFFADLAKAYNQEFAELAGLGLRYLQIDDTNLAYMCDAKIRKSMSDLGEDLDQMLQQYCGLINASIAGLPDDMNVCLHLCRGNYGRFVSGSYEQVAERLFNDIDVNGFFLEYDDERAGGFEPLRHLPKGKRVALGLVTTKSPEIETKDTLKRRIDEAAKYAPLDQLALCPQCGFGTGAGVPARQRSNPNRRFLTFDEVTTKLSTIVETARDVWGDA